jgi:hypothetical protein
VADITGMAVHPDNLTWTQSDAPIRVILDGDTDYTRFDDQQLATERDNQRHQLDELDHHPASSTAVVQLRATLQREVDRMTDELTRRARSRHPSSRGIGDRFRSFRSLSWPPKPE